MSTPYPPSEGRDGRDGEQASGGYGAPPPPGGYGEAQGGGYGQPPAGSGYPGSGAPGDQYGSPQGSPSNGMGWAALILGILGVLSFWLLIGGLFGLLALIFGIIAFGRSRRGQATNGWAGVVGAVLGALALLGAILVGLLIGAIWNSDEAENLRDCLDGAGTDTAAREDCQRQFEDELQDGTNSSLRLVLR